MKMNNDNETSYQFVQNERLVKYSFERKVYDPEMIGLLIGNAELGGLADVSGLAVRKVWATDIQKDEFNRMSVEGFGLICDEFPATREPLEYSQTLSLTDGVLRTRAIYGDGVGYESELFCSMMNPHLIVLRIRNLGGEDDRRWCVVRPVSTDDTVTRLSSEALCGHNTQNVFYTHYTRTAWAIRANSPWTIESGHEVVYMAPNDELTLLYSHVTQHDGDDYKQLCVKAVSEKTEFKSLKEDHCRIWSKLWNQSAVLAIPDDTLERMWYRSMYWTLSTCGSQHFLPGESMFAVDCWGMGPFTVGAAGWAVHVFIATGFPERAKAMLEWHFKADALNRNAGYYVNTLTGRPAGSDAWSFAHQVCASGDRYPCRLFDLQRHIDGFAATMFYRYNRYYPNDRYYMDRVYPVLRGVTRFYQELASLDNKSDQYILPQMTSLTEDLHAVNPIDAALAAKWCVLETVRCSEELKLDAELRSEWKRFAEKLYIPQTDERYTEYFGDKERGVLRGDGYQGIRGFVYLGYPTVELKPFLDRDKVVRTLDYTWERNNHGEGMISFVANWFALADAYFGRGDHALSVMRHNLKCLDKWDTSIRETQSSKNYYFATGYTSFVLVPLAMAVQSVNDTISTFPAVPSEWKDFAFYNVPAESDIRVSGEMKGGKCNWVSYRKNGKEVLRTNRKGVVEIVKDGQSVMLKTNLWQ